MELEKYIKNAKEAINKGYFDIQDALMNRYESLKRLKATGWKSDETAYRQEYQKIVDTFNQVTSNVVAMCKSKVQEQKDGYMKEVKEFYASDGSRIDLNFMNLIKAELPLTVEEITDEIHKNADNPTMLRVINKYVLERNAHLPEGKKIKLDNAYQIALYKASFHGEKEEKIFDEFVQIAGMALNHPDESFTMCQASLDDYEEDAHLRLLKAKIFIDAETKGEIEQIEEEQRKKNNEKNKGKTPDFFHGAYTFS